MTVQTEPTNPWHGYHFGPPVCPECGTQLHTPACGLGRVLRETREARALSSPDP